MTALMQTVAFLGLCVLVVWTLGSITLLFREERKARRFERHVREALLNVDDPEGRG